jgi:aerobic carbon-monoxide dehydrogenase large subunit
LSPRSPAATWPPDYGSLPTAWNVGDDLIVPDHLPIATEEVRYRGDAVAVVTAESAYQAADAVEAVQVGYDRLPAVVDMMAALAPEAPLVHADKGTNRAFTWGFTAGDYEGAMRRAKVVVSRRFVQQRLLPIAMEPRAIVADPTPATGEFTLWTSTQVPHFVRILMSSVWGIPEQKLRVIAPDVGGGFGGKLNVYAEEAIALAVARRLGRPVKWIATRGEDYQATTHGRDMIQDVEIAATRDGRVLGLKVALTSDMEPTFSCSRRPFPCSGGTSTPASTSSKHMTSSARESSRPRPRRTPTAAPAARRRRSPSSGSWTSRLPTSAWTRWNCGSGTGSPTPSSRTRRSPG